MKNVSLELKNMSIPTKVKFGFAVVKQMTNNAFFATPIPTLSDLEEATTNLKTAAAAAANGGKLLTKEMNTKERALDKVLRNMGLYVTSIANKYKNAEEVINSANMIMKRITKPNIPTLGAKQGKMKGSIKLRRKAVKGRPTYLIQLSEDNGKTWTDIFIATKATSIITGLKSDTRYWFRVAVIVKNVQYDFCESVSIVVI